ncbi:response regulator [Pedobacter sp.]
MIDGVKLMLANTPYKIVGENKSAVNALSEIAALQPDIVITDISMPEMTGVELVRRLKQQNSSLKILVLSMFDNPASLGDLKHSNISGFVLKDKGKDELIYAIEQVSKSQIYFSQ